MQCGCSLKRLSREKEGRMNSLFLGTVILLIQTTSTVYVGVDSKVISIDSKITNAEPVPKIHHIG